MLLVKALTIITFLSVVVDGQKVSGSEGSGNNKAHRAHGSSPSASNRATTITTNSAGSSYGSTTAATVLPAEDVDDETKTTNRGEDQRLFNNLGSVGGHRGAADTDARSVNSEGETGTWRWKSQRQYFLTGRNGKRKGTGKGGKGKAPPIIEDECNDLEVRNDVAMVSHKLAVCVCVRARVRSLPFLFVRTFA